MSKKSRLLCLFLCFTPTLGFAAKVTKLNPTTKTVTIDEGTATGFQKKGKVCFYDESGAKIGCGSVKSAKEKIATIRFKSAKTFAKIKEGLEARVEEAGINAATPVEAQAASPGKYIAAYGSFPGINSVGYSSLAYETPEGQSVSSMWSAETRPKIVGMGLEYGMGLGSNVLAFGLRSRIPLTKGLPSKSRKVATDYDDKEGDGEFEQYAESTTSYSSIGGFVDFNYLNYSMGFANFVLGNGLDIDSSNLTFKMVQKDDSNESQQNTLYAATSTMMAIFLRTNIMLDFNLGTFGFRFGTTVFLPLSQSQKFSLDTEADPFTSNLKDLKAEADLKDSLEYKAKLGVDVTLSTRFNF